jgi:hypothetical protein
MTTPARAFARVALWALPIWAAMLFFGTLTHQPDTRTDFAGFARYVTTSGFLWSHLINSIAGAAIGSIGTLALVLYLQDTPAAGRSILGMVATVLGNTMTSAIFGVAAFAQPAIGRAFLDGQQAAPAMYDAVYGNSLFGTAIVALLLFIVGGIFVGIAIAACGRFPPWTGWVYAIASVAFVVSNFTVAEAQTPMSILLFVAAAVVAWTASRQTAPHADGARPAAAD